MDEIRHPHLKIKICVSGAAETGHCGVDALEIGKEIGKEIGISPRTVEKHVQHLKEKLNCKNQKKLIAELLQLSAGDL